MRKIYVAGVCFLLVLLSAGCKKTERIARSDAKEVLSFAFFAYANGGKLDIDVPGAVSGSAITVSLPAGMTVGYLTATIEVSPLAQISVDGQVPGSGEGDIWELTADFSSPVLLTVKAEDGSTATYTVTVTSEPLSSEKEFLSLKFLKADNPSLIEDVTAQISGNVIAVTLPAGANAQLYAIVEVSDHAAVKYPAGETWDISAKKEISLDVDGAMDPSLSTTPVHVQAQDGTIRLYEIRTSWESGDVRAPESRWAEPHVNRVIFRTGRDDSGTYIFIWPTTATLEYDEQGRVIRIRYYHYMEDPNRGHHRKYALFAYDDYEYSGNTVTVVAHQRLDPIVYQRATFTMGDNGYPAHLIYNYDWNGAEYEATYTYNSAANLVKKETKGAPWDGPGVLTGSSDPTAYQHTYSYEYENGNLIKAVTTGTFNEETTYEYHTDKANYEDWNQGLIRFQVNSHAGSGWEPGMGKHSKNLLKRSRYRSFDYGYTSDVEYQYEFDAAGRVTAVNRYTQVDGQPIDGRPMRIEFSYSK